MKRINIEIAVVVTVLVFAGAWDAFRENIAVPSYSYPLAISEICLKNKTCGYDENGEYGADYIEIYNQSDKEIDLTGYALSDSRKNLQKFVFEGITIAPHGTIVIWNNEDVAGTEYLREDYVAEDIHNLSFGLKAGENLFFLNANGDLIQQIPLFQTNDGMVISSTLANLSYYQESAPSLHYVDEKIGINRASNVLAKPTFSIPGGWYRSDVEITLGSPYGGAVHYTLDGTEPNGNSPIFDEAIIIYNRSKEKNRYASIDGISIKTPYLPDEPVDKGTVVKAIVIDEDGNMSKVASQTYFVGLNDDSYDDVSVMEITINPDDFFGMQNGIYVLGTVYANYLKKYYIDKFPNYIYYNANYAKEGKGWERPVHIEFYSEDHQRILEQDAGIRIHGNWSVAYNQKSFNLYARQEYDGKEYFLYDFFGQKYNKIMLRAGGYRDIYSTKIRDIFNQSLVEGRHIGIQKAEPCAVFINGEYWGLYNLQETIGTGYIQAYYDVNPENVLIMKNDEINTDNEEDKKYWEEIVGFAKENDLSVAENYDYICERIDIQSYIDYFCFQIYVANCDSVANNFARWRSIGISGKPYEDGKWRWLLYDTDDSVGMVTNLSNYAVDSFIGGHWTNDPLGERGDALFSALIKNDDFKIKFISTFLEMSNTNFIYKDIHSKLMILADRYEAAVVKSQQRFRGSYKIGSYEELMIGEIYTEEDFWHDVNVIDEFYKKRRDYIIECLYNDLDLYGK